MTAALYRTSDGDEITIAKVEDACTEVATALGGAVQVLRFFSNNGDIETAGLCDAMIILLLHVDQRIVDIRPGMASLNEGRKAGADG